MEIDEIKHIKDVLQKKPQNSSLFNDNLAQIKELWSIESKDRNLVLKAQIFVEHYCTEVLLSYFRSSGATEEINNLRFSEKLNILKNIDSRTKDIASCLKKINFIRNQFAHKFDYEITKSDINGLKGNETISELVNKYNIETDGNTYGEIIGIYAQLCGMHLAATASTNRSINNFRDYYFLFKVNENSKGFEGLIDEVLKSDEA